MLLPQDFFSLPFLALYAETHFRFFRLFPSFLFMRQPEVIFDAPRRLGPGQDLPIVLIVNDCHRFPARLTECAVAVSGQQSKPERFDFPDLAAFEVEHPWRAFMRAFILPVPRSKLSSGRVFITCRITINCGKKRHIVINDNLRTTQKKSFSCVIADAVLPGSKFCSYGDLHVHSQYSQSHVEFGPPLQVIDKVAHASGLSFVGITDHSYDLACSMENYLLPDPDLQRWKLQQKELSDSKKFTTILIPGEEISCLNSRKEVVHLCGLGMQNFIPGSLDGARKGRTRERHYSLGEAVEAIHKQKGIASAAHPGVRQGFLERLFLFRGEWSEQDLRHNAIDAMQLFNNGFSLSFNAGKILWLKMLQQGLKVPLLAGNDAHGDFNRYRAITIPFFSIGENICRYMGSGRTGIYGRPDSISGLIDGIHNGATFITTGPFAALCSSTSPADSIPTQQQRPGNLAEVYVHAISTPEFGALRNVTVYAGGYAGSAGSQAPLAEKSIFSRNYSTAEYQTCEKVELASLSTKPLYVRVEVACAAPEKTDAEPSVSKAVTSAVFLN